MFFEIGAGIAFAGIGFMAVILGIAMARHIWIDGTKERESKEPVD